MLCQLNMLHFLIFHGSKLQVRTSDFNISFIGIRHISCLKENVATLAMDIFCIFQSYFSPENIIFVMNAQNKSYAMNDIRTQITVTIGTQIMSYLLNTSSSRLQMFFKISVLKKFLKLHRKTPVLESLFNKAADLNVFKTKICICYVHFCNYDIFAMFRESYS